MPALRLCVVRGAPQEHQRGASTVPGVRERVLAVAELEGVGMKAKPEHFRPAHLYFKAGSWRFKVHPELSFPSSMWRDAVFRCAKWCTQRDKRQGDPMWEGRA